MRKTFFPPSRRPGQSSLSLSVLAFLAVVLALEFSAAAQGTKADYERAARLRQVVSNKVFNIRLEPHWLTNQGAPSTRFWYRAERPGNRTEFILVDAETGKKQPAFDHERLASALSQAGGREFKPEGLPVEALQFDDDAAKMTFRLQGRSWSCDLKSYEVEKSTNAFLAEA